MGSTRSTEVLSDERLARMTARVDAAVATGAPPRPDRPRARSRPSAGRRMAGLLGAAVLVSSTWIVARATDHPASARAAPADAACHWRP